MIILGAAKKSPFRAERFNSCPVMYEAASEARNAIAARPRQGDQGGRWVFEPAITSCSGEDAVSIQPGAKGVYSDFFAGNFEGKTASHSNQAGFRRTVSCVSELSDADAVIRISTRSQRLDVLCSAITLGRGKYGMMSSRLHGQLSGRKLPASLAAAIEG
jgi:hypothetical protein